MRRQQVTFTAGDNDGDETQFPNLRIVHTERGSTPLPPMDDQWDKLTKLQWHAAVARERSGIAFNVSPASYRVGRIKQRGYYNVSLRYPDGQFASSIGPITYDQAWMYINGVEAGAHALKEMA